MKPMQALTHILDAMEDGIYITREDYTVEFMNRANDRHVRRGHR